MENFKPGRFRAIILIPCVFILAIAMECIDRRSETHKPQDMIEKTFEKENPDREEGGGSGGVGNGVARDNNEGGDGAGNGAPADTENNGDERGGGRVGNG
ncbi:MAG: hypothetical protein N4A44_00910 [Alphaproteobacteria bacterium]|jgi:hypothetical protein|nr:hypothetical protein [Alphaproteobacteria bacterium]